MTESPMSAASDADHIRAAGAPAGHLNTGAVDAGAVAGGVDGPRTVRRLAGVVLNALEEGAAARGGPLPGGGPEAVADRVRSACEPLLPAEGVGAEAALDALVRAVAEGAADPADPHCAAHLHCPPLAAGVIEERTTAALAELVYPGRPAPDSIITSGGTESNLVALLLARERARERGARSVQVLCGATAHHSVHRAAWMLGLPTPLTVECRAGRMLPAALDRALAETRGTPALVVATAGTTDEGMIDPLPEIAEVVATHGAELHVDAAYGGPLLFSERLRDRLSGIDSAVSVTFDLHKLGWQPVAAGVLAVADASALEPLAFRADYLNADDDTEAGLPDLLGRSIRTSRRPDTLKVAATLRALGRSGLGGLVEGCVAAAERFAGAIDAHPALRRRPGPVGISTVLFRPAAADALPDERGDELVAEVRRTLLAEGRAVLGRALAEDADGRQRLWLKATLLNPAARDEDLAGLLKLVADSRPLIDTAADGRPPADAVPAGPRAGGGPRADVRAAADTRTDGGIR
ncbi:pyridoxal phosphate-dependent decarboxylase family protein [Streptomyces sp. URMC 123]|uniref:pyridoxal phosphate-dependent decarboxylase family protein n=1 Tax=Streptomyces sp. URMC 123 TaxID=3423403 RepID=UPI003F1D3C44